jgi:hypothetical protein
MANSAISQLPLSAGANTNDLLVKDNASTGPTQRMPLSQILALQSVQTQNLIDATLAGNTSGALALISSGTMTLAGGNNITLSQAGNAVTISAGAGGAAVSDSFGMSNLGNTSGTTGVITGSNLRFVLAGGNNVTLSQSINGSSATVTISAFNQSVQTQNLLDATLAGNTSGALALISSGTMTLAGGNNITLSQAGNAVTISAQSQGADTQGISNLGNTAGTSGVVSGANLLFVLAGGSNITLSQSINGSSATITINGATAAGGTAPTINLWENMDLDGTGAAPLGGMVVTYDSVGVFPLMRQGVFPGNMTPATMNLLATLSGSTATMSQAFSSSLFVGIYTLNASTLSLLNSVVTTWGSGAANANLSTMRAGIRWITIHSSLWSAQPVLTMGHYWIATLIRSSGVSDQTASFFGQAPYQVGSILSGTVGISQVNATTVGYLPFFGRMSVSSVSLPGTIGSADINKQVILGSNIPLLRFNNLIASY